MDTNITSKDEGHLQMTANICIGTATILLNVFSMVCILKSVTLCYKQKILFTSLLFSDFLVGIQVVAVRISTYKINGTDMICRVRMYSALLLTFFTIFINFVLTFDRFLSLALTMPYDNMINCRTLRFIMPCIVVISTGFTIIFFMGDTKKSNLCKFVISDNPKGFVFLGVNICLAFILILLMNVYIGRVARRHIRQIASTVVRDETTNSTCNSSFNKSEMKTNITVAIISILFGISYCPLGIMCIYHGLNSIKMLENHVLVFDILVTCFMLNSLLNPIAYIWRLKQCREEILNRILCRMHNNNREPYS